MEEDLLEDFNQYDPLEEVRLNKIRNSGLEETMRFAFTRIDSLGLNNWIKALSEKTEDYRFNILNNMLIWFEEREEYEKCAKIKTWIEKL